jgi:Fur family transcriptional regulator, zinc uptake regulator
MMMQLRDTVLRILRESDAPLGAYEIVKRVAILRGGTCHANSVYRVLSPLIQSGEVQSIVTTRSFKLTDPGTETPIWCLCQKCKTSRPISASPIHQALDAAARAKLFQPVQNYVELIGICSDCVKSDPHQTAAATASNGRLVN